MPRTILVAPRGRGCALVVIPSVAIATARPVVVVVVHCLVWSGLVWFRLELPPQPRRWGFVFQPGSRGEANSRGYVCRWSRRNEGCAGFLLVKFEALLLSVKVEVHRRRALVGDSPTTALKPPTHLYLRWASLSHPGPSTSLARLINDTRLLAGK
jgi:hypothetical protein